MYCSAAAFFSLSRLFLVPYICFSSSPRPKCMPRRARPPSLSLDAVPIPPSLLASPFLSSPAFTRPTPVSHLPTERDELWLQDTVPLPVSPSPSESSGSLLNSQPPRPSPQLCRRPIPQSPPIVINRSLHTHVRGHTYPESHLSNFSHYRNSYGRSGSSSEPQSPLSSSSSSCRSSLLPYRPPDAVDPRPPRRLKFSHVRIHSDSVLPTHTDSICLRNLRTEESRRSGECPHMEFGCGRMASD